LGELSIGNDKSVLGLVIKCIGNSILVIKCIGSDKNVLGIIKIVLGIINFFLEFKMD